MVTDYVLFQRRFINIGFLTITDFVTPMIKPKKIHKSKFGIRPIVNTRSTPTCQLCNFIGKILNPFVKKIPSYLRDSQQLIQETLNLNISEDHVLCSADFENLMHVQIMKKHYKRDKTVYR
jgi:hypothetical protein